MVIEVATGTFFIGSMEIFVKKEDVNFTNQNVDKHSCGSTVFFDRIEVRENLKFIGHILSIFF